MKGSTRAIAIVLATSLIVLSVGMSWAVADDYLGRDIVPAGAVALGPEGTEPVEIGGLTSATAAKLIDERIGADLYKPTAVAAGPEKVTVDPTKFIVVDSQAMVAQAMAPQRAIPLPERVARRVAAKPLDIQVPLAVKVDDAAVKTWALALQKQVGRPAVDSTITITNREFKVNKAANGYSVDDAVAAAALTKALTEGKHEVALQIQVLKPKVTPKELGKTLFVRRNDRRVWLYDGDKLEITFPVAVGTPGYPTPLGNWFIERKVKNPSWHNPHAPWSATMPEVIPPGPSNPLGTRALYLNAAGIRFHGTNKRGSVGTAASHGCMRMLREDIEDLFPRVPVGTRVIIIR